MVCRRRFCCKVYSKGNQARDEVVAGRGPNAFPRCRSGLNWRVLPRRAETEYIKVILGCQYHAGAGWRSRPGLGEHILQRLSLLRHALLRHD